MKSIVSSVYSEATTTLKFFAYDKQIAEKYQFVQNEKIVKGKEVWVSNPNCVGASKIQVLRATGGLPDRSIVPDNKILEHMGTDPNDQFNPRTNRNNYVPPGATYNARQKGAFNTEFSGANADTFAKNMSQELGGNPGAANGFRTVGAKNSSEVVDYLKSKTLTDGSDSANLALMSYKQKGAEYGHVTAIYYNPYSKKVMGLDPMYGTQDWGKASEFNGQRSFVPEGRNTPVTDKATAYGIAK